MLDAVDTKVGVNGAHWATSPQKTVAFSQNVFLHPSAFSGTEDFFTNMGLDFVGVSAYFSIFDAAAPHTLGPHSRCTYENGWTNVMSALGTYWYRNTLIPVVAFELGIPNRREAPFEPASAGQDRKDGEESINGRWGTIEDGDETQGNELWGYFRARSECDDLLEGQFLWDNPISDDVDWAAFANKYRIHGVRSWDLGNSHGMMRYSEDEVSAAQDDAVWSQQHLTPDTDLPVQDSNIMPEKHQ